LDEISVTIRAEKAFGASEGSGTLIVRKVDGKNVCFVWTAAHVVDDLKKTKTVRINGKKKEIVYFDPVQIVKDLYEDDELVGDVRMRAVVVKFNRAHDLALLRVLKKDFSKANTRFYLGEKTPGRGTKVFHVGSLLGKTGSNSMTDGLISALGRKPERSDLIYDQTTVTAVPGSSGGGVFLQKTGEYVGMLVAGYRGSDGFNLIVPVRRMRSWAKEAGVLWALDPKIKTPSEKELKKIPVTGTYDPKLKAKKKDGETPKPEIHGTDAKAPTLRRFIIRTKTGAVRLDCSEHPGWRCKCQKKDLKPFIKK
jgi:hypothetical protein